jgi:putative glutamine amidotransferase
MRHWPRAGRREKRGFVDRRAAREHRTVRPDRLQTTSGREWNPSRLHPRQRVGPLGVTGWFVGLAIGPTGATQKAIAQVADDRHDVRTRSETLDSGRTIWTDVYPCGYGLKPRVAEIYVHMRTRPLIAVTTSELRRPEDVTARPQGEPPKLEVALATLYPEAIERAGGIPVIVPLLRPDGIAALLDRVDGVCLPGGPDVQPSAYGAEPHPELGPTEPRVDAVELALVRAADRRKLPILGICRGMQLLNVARGGTLHQHLPDVGAAGIEHRQPDHGSIPTHRIGTASRSRLRATLGGPGLEVNSFHHQAVHTLGKGLVATAWADDGTIEAIESPGDRLVIGVQWHAEGLLAHDPLFELLIAAAAGVAEEVAQPRALAQGAGEPRRLASARARSVRPRRACSAQRLASAG